MTHCDSFLINNWFEVIGQSRWTSKDTSENICVRVQRMKSEIAHWEVNNVTGLSKRSNLTLSKTWFMKQGNLGCDFAVIFCQISPVFHGYWLNGTSNLRCRRVKKGSFIQGNSKSLHPSHSVKNLALHHLSSKINKNRKLFLIVARDLNLLFNIKYVGQEMTTF